VVTGASRGIGLATARALCAEGASVLLTARSQEDLEAAAESCAGGRAAVLARPPRAAACSPPAPPLALPDPVARHPRLRYPSPEPRGAV